MSDRTVTRNEMEGKRQAAGYVRERVAVSGKTGLGTGWWGRMRRTRPSGAVVSLSVVGCASRRDDFEPSSSRTSCFQIVRRAPTQPPNFLSLSISLSLSLSLSLFLSLSYFISSHHTLRRIRSLVRLLRAPVENVAALAPHFKLLATSRRGCRRLRSSSRMSISVCVSGNVRWEIVRGWCCATRAVVRRSDLRRDHIYKSRPSRPPKSVGADLDRCASDRGTPPIIVLSPSAARDHPRGDAPWLHSASRQVDGSRHLGSPDIASECNR